MSATSSKKAAEEVKPQTEYFHETVASLKGSQGKRGELCKTGGEEMMVLGTRLTPLGLALHQSINIPKASLVLVRGQLYVPTFRMS